MSPTSAFIYNVLTMGLIFPWVYLQAPGSLVGGQLAIGIVLAVILEIPIALSYVWLSTALPRSGGDYVFQSRVLGGGIGFTLVFSGFVIWILQWVALSGWLVSYLGFGALFLGLGATLDNPTFLDWSTFFFSANGVVVVSIANAALALVILASGLRTYIRLQVVMIVGTLVAFATTLVVLFLADPSQVPTQLNAFSSAIGGSATFYEDAVAAVKGAGIDLNPPVALLATLLVAPIAWTSVQWATYSSEQNGEIKTAADFRSQAYIIVGSLIFTGALLAILAVAFERALGSEFLIVAGAGYWLVIPEAQLNGIWLFPNIVAVALNASPIVVLLIALGFILNGHQIVHNCYIGMTRVMLAMSFDRLLPEVVSRVSERFHTPVNAHVIYFVASIPVIILYNLFSYTDAAGSTITWFSFTLAVTFACGWVFVATALAGALMPYRAKTAYEASAGAKYTIGGIPAVTLIGGLGFIAGLIFEIMFIFNESLGLTADLLRITALGTLAFAAGWYLVAKFVQRGRGINVDYAFKEVPPE
jgi:amino acid transporter